jgi:hypothetical protein
MDAELTEQIKRMEEETKRLKLLCKKQHKSNSHQDPPPHGGRAKESGAKSMETSATDVHGGKPGGDDADDRRADDPG